MLKILHISDLHLDAKFAWLGKDAKKQRQRIQDTLSKSIDYAIKEKLNLIVITGDIFDTPHPDQLDVDKFKKILKPAIELGIRIVILPGNHDHVVKNGVWSNEFSGLDVLSDPTSTRLELKELNTVVYGEAQTSKKNPNSPLKKVLVELKNNNENDNGMYKVVLAHGGVVTSIKANKDANNPITQEEIEQLAEMKVNYLALGDWHGLKEIKNKNIPAYYPGSIELLDLKQKNSGYGILVKLTEPSQQAQIETKRFSSLQLVREDLNINQHTQETIQNYLSSRKNNDTLLRIKITGTQSLKDNLNQTKLDVTSLIEDNINDFYFLKITDNSDIQVSQSDIADFPKESVPYNFIKLMEEETKSSNIPQELEDEILSLGLNIIIGNKND